jgi:hypothetical protein
MYNKIIIYAVSLTALVVLGAGCNGSDGPPVLVSPDGSVYVGVSEPSVDEELADEAWRKRLIFHVGPVDLPAGTERMDDSPLAMSFQTDENIWVTAFEPRVVDASGAELPSSLIHKAIVSNMHEDNPVCSESGVGNPAFMTTSLLTSVELPQGYGYPVLATDPLEAQVVLQNPTEESYSQVFFEITLVARPMNEFTNLADVKPMLLEFNPCDHSDVEVEPDSFEELKASYRTGVPARVIMVSGAMGEYGSAISLTAGSEIVPFWSSEAILGEGHELMGLTENPYVDMQTNLTAEDEVTLGATFDNAKDDWLEGAVAGAMIYVNPEE